MEIINQIGHLQHWGLTPAANLLRQYPFQKHEGRPLRLLISGTADIRHLLKTLCDINEKPPTHKPTIEVYYHETNKELLCRAVLLLQVLHETNLNFEERIELFLDLYANAMIKERNARYLHSLREDLLNFIHDEKKVATPLKGLLNLKLLRFEDRDDLGEIISSWSMKAPLDMETMRDNKVRFLYKERYDYRANLVDWDFNMLLKDCAPIVHFYHYKEWRMTGLAYEQRFSRYTEPNRTLASYAPGKMKVARTTCLVRGYWGDIMMSPYIALGVRCDYHQSDLLFKKANEKNIGHSIEIAEYNMNYWLHRLDKEQQYTRVFRDYYRADDQTRKTMEKKGEIKKKEKKEKDDLKEIEEEEEEDDIKDIKEKDDIKEEENKETKESKEEAAKKRKQKEKEKNLDSDEEEQKERVDLYNSKDIDYKTEEKQILAGFRNYNLSVHLMAMDSDKLVHANKFKDFFDVVCLGFAHSGYLTKGVESIARPGGLLLVEKGSYLVPKKKEERKQLNTKLRGLIEEKGLYEQGEDEENLFAYFKK